MLRGADIFASGVSEEFLGRNVAGRTLIELGGDSLTQNENTTDNILTAIDIGVTIVDLGSGIYLLKKRFDAATRLADDVARTAPGGAIESLMKGRRAGEVVSDAALDRLERGLLRDGVVISRNADQMLAGRRAGGIFRLYGDDSVTIFLRSNPTRYELLHELQHLEHLRAIGPARYRQLARTASGNLQLEQQVYDTLRRLHWDALTPAEIQHARDYIRLLGGNPW